MLVEGIFHFLIIEQKVFDDKFFNILLDKHLHNTTLQYHEIYRDFPINFIIKDLDREFVNIDDRDIWMFKLLLTWMIY